MPTLRVITSCSQKSLLAAFADSICAAPLLPLEKECIVVLSHGMARWISIEFAALLGVSAGLEFIFPNDLLDNCFASILPESPTSFPFTHISLTWRIAAILPSLSSKNGFEQVATYLGDGHDDRRLLQLSRSLADCFDQYTIFRPEMICAWDDGADDNWQAQVWRAINSDSHGRHRAAKLRELQTHVVSGASSRIELPRRITLFGISYLPPFHLDALGLFSTYSDVTCYLLNPCGQYWGTIISEQRMSRLALQATLPEEADEYYETGNTLLSSLGTLGQEFFESLLDHGFEVEELDRAPEDSRFESSAAQPSLLAAIQHDIITLFDRSADGVKSCITADDRSLQIHSCHGALREMEILYDNLLELFENRSDLEPRHVVVMIPDIEAYAPYISSVFGSRSPGRPQLQYTIADRSIRRESLYIEAFLKLITAATSRFALQEIFDILENPSISNCFEIDEEERIVLKNRLKDCNVRWGYNADHRVDLGFPRYDDFSWQAGLDKLFLGYAMSPENKATFTGILPYSTCSGRQADALGKLAEFISTLRKFTLRLSVPHTLTEWADILTAMTTQMLRPDENDPAGPLTVAKAINSLHEASAVHGFLVPLTVDAVQDHLADILAKSCGGYGFMGGSITFCTMLPMRSIPMRVIWLAGMSDGQFPRTEMPPGFSIMNGARRRGDRSLRDEDRYLFLEALMAAEECFCISYNGQDDRNNSTLPPSVLVAELMDYVTSGFVLPDGISPVPILIRHRLQGFSPHYFNNSDPDHLFSYDQENFQALESGRISGLPSQRKFIDKPLAIDGTSPLMITLQQLKRFLANPAAAFLEQRLQVTLFNPEGAADDSEPFSLDSLTGYQLSQELVSHILRGSGYKECLTAAQSRGVLPPLSTGKVTFDTVWERCRQFTSMLEPMLGPPLEPLTVDFTHNGMHLHAVIENCQGGIHLRWRCAGMKGKDRLSLWLEHLLLNIAKVDDYPIQSKMVASDMALELTPVDHAAEILSDLLDIYCEGMKSPLRFFPETSWAFQNDGQQKAEATWRGDSWRGFSGECDNQAIALCFGGNEPWGDEFRSLAARIYAPIIEAIPIIVQ